MSRPCQEIGALYNPIVPGDRSRKEEGRNFILHEHCCWRGVRQDDSSAPTLNR
jgi:hypothetical protein